MKNKIAWKKIERLEEIHDLVIQTPMGPFNSNDPGSPLNQFEFELMLTNFRITEDILDRLNKTRGVEALCCLSSYSTLICVGKLFNKDKVKEYIELDLTGSILNNNLSKDDIPSELIKQSPSILFPNGEFLPINDDNEEISKECAEFVGGIVL